MAKRPLDILNDALDSNVLIRLKGQREFRGQLQGYDMHMNLVMDNTEEILADNSTKKFGTIVVRGDNIIFISP